MLADEKTAEKERKSQEILDVISYRNNPTVHVLNVDTACVQNVFCHPSIDNIFFHCVPSIQVFSFGFR